MSFWSGETIVGCVIDKGNMTHFIQKYLEMNPQDFADEEDKESAMWDALFCAEGFNCAFDAGKEDGKQFYAQFLSDDTYDGCYLNTKNDTKRLWGGDFILVSADKWLTTRAIIEGGYYTSWEEIVEEFKNKLGAYLPSDFDYENSIGDVDYACFA